MTEPEFARCCELIGRVPNLTELGLFSVMWSEHCSYKSSRVHLRKLPTTSPAVLQGPGENAGVVDLGDGLAAAFKIESHNHPSFVEPYQGAATGVGGILRDIFTMGARPIALMDALRFGALDSPRTRSILEGVVGGIAGYGNCMGVPVVGGDLDFDACYDGNPLVNAFCLGIVRHDRIVRGVARGIGNPVIYVGAKTGRDGIHGVSLLASAEFDQTSSAKRPTVQVGDPFLEKLVMEACLEIAGSDALVGMQDMGGAGLTCATSEMAAKGGVGMRVDLDRVPVRETGMSPYELLLSESQERMLLVARRGREHEILRVFSRWGLDAVVIGEVTEGPWLEYYRGGELAARVPARALADEAPVYQRAVAAPPEWQGGSEALAEKLKREAALLARDLSHLAEIEAIKSWTWRQYDHHVRTNTVVGPGQGKASVLRLKGTPKALALRVKGRHRWCRIHPRLGAALTVMECARDLAKVGARPLAITNNLNFGNPEKPMVMWQFQEAVEGMAEACRALGIAVVSGNVSFYNETEGRAIAPTPVIGMVGLIDDLNAVRPLLPAAS